MSKCCARCQSKEFRIDGYCSIYCRDMHELELLLTRAAALAEAAKAAKLQARLCMDTKIFTIGEAKYIFDVLDSALAAYREER